MRPHVGNVQDLSPADVGSLQVAECTAVKSPSGQKHAISLNQLYYHSSVLGLWPLRTGARVAQGQRWQPLKVKPVLFFPL